MSEKHTLLYWMLHDDEDEEMRFFAEVYDEIYNPGEDMTEKIEPYNSWEPPKDVRDKIDEIIEKNKIVIIEIYGSNSKGLAFLI